VTGCDVGEERIDQHADAAGENLFLEVAARDQPRGFEVRLPCAGIAPAARTTEFVGAQDRPATRSGRDRDSA